MEEEILYTKKTKYKTVKLNAALEVVRINKKKLEAVLLYFMDWKIDRPAKHDLQLCAPVCQATFTLNYATASVDIPVYVVTMARSICSLCLHGLRILTS